MSEDTEMYLSKIADVLLGVEDHLDSLATSLYGYANNISPRDYFAAAALTSMLSTPQEIGPNTPERVADLAFKVADAMIKRSLLDEEK